jgi:hypothetical protein
MIIALLLINILFTAVILLLIREVRELNERIYHEVKHSLQLEKTIEFFVKK